MNKVVILGRLAADPELRQTSNGISVTSFTVAVDRSFSKNAERQTDWIDVTAWRSTAEFICKYFQKGKPIIVEGSLQTRTYDDKNGSKHKVTEIVADNVEFVPGTGNGSGARSDARPVERVESAAPIADPAPLAFSNGSADDFSVVEEDDLPF